MVNSGALQLQREREMLLQNDRKRFSAKRYYTRRTCTEALTVKERPHRKIIRYFQRTCGFLKTSGRLKNQ